MNAASQPRKARREGRLLAMTGELRHLVRAELPDLFVPGDLLVLNDAATLPAGIYGVHVQSGLRVEVRLAERRSLDPRDLHDVGAIVLGDGDHHTRTEHRAEPPRLDRGDTILVHGTRATVCYARGRFARLSFDRDADVFSLFVENGHVIQYAHVPEPLALWDAQTVIAGPPVSFEAPSAAFALDWETLHAIAARGVHIATLTHAAGLSSTGDAALDASLPWAEPYAIPRRTAELLAEQKRKHARVIAVGTTVVRALEDDSVDRIARHRVDARRPPRIVDAILSGMRAPGESHFELLRAFTDDVSLLAAHHVTNDYLSHEYGDSMFVSRNADRVVG